MLCLRKRNGSNCSEAAVIIDWRVVGSKTSASRCVDSHSCHATFASAMGCQTAGLGGGGASVGSTRSTSAQVIMSPALGVTWPATLNGPRDGAADGTLQRPSSFGKPYTSRPTTTASAEST